MGFFDKWLDMAQGGEANHGTIGVDLPEVEGRARYRMTFHGQVQGVGFRYTMRLEAQGLGITGWVHNHYDGSVVAEVQAENRAIRMLVYRMQEGRFIRISSIDVEQIPVDVRETTFSVK